MPRVPRGRHVSYPDRTPAARELPSVTCLDNIPEFLGGRHFSYTVHGTPLSAWDWACCDVFCTPEEIETDDCYKLPDCYTLGPGPGISKRIALYAFDVDDCWSARGIIETLTYDVADDKWKGSVALRAGTLTLEFECVAGLPDNDPEKFKLTVTASCLPTNPTVLLAGYQCSDPLMIAFTQFIVGGCCQCRGEGDPPITDRPAQVQFFVAANCRAPRVGRHEWYKVEGSTVTPASAHARNCSWDQGDDYVCANMQCPLNATVTDVTDCACLAGSYPLDYTSGGWLFAGEMCSPTVGTIAVACTDNGDGTVTLQVDVVCGASNTGTASVTIPAADLEDLDETVTVTMTDPLAGTCTGTCTYQWNAMSMSWANISDDCSGTGCGCVDPLTLPPGTVDGETMQVACTGGYTVPCCVGTISVRLMRAA